MPVVELSVAPESAPGGRRQRPSVVALTAVLLALAGAAAVWLRRDPPPDPPWPEDLVLPSPPQADFVDADHGYVLLGDCAMPTCEAWIGVTRDGGQTWHAAPVPGLEFPAHDAIQGIRAQLIALDDQHAILDGYENAAAVSVVPLALSSIRPASGRRWYTSDGGQSWSRVTPDPLVVVDEIPDGAYVTAALAPHQHEQIVVRLIRLDGTSAVLATRPTVPHEVGELDARVMMAPDGSHWLVARGPDDTTILVSRDRGRTWTTLPWPAGHPAPGHRYDFHAGDGETIYVVDSGAFRAWRSRDAGQTWQELDVPFSSGIPDTGLTGVSLPDGRLLVFQPLNLAFVTVPTGTTFTRADPSLAFLPAGRVLVPAADGTAGLAGADGSWQPLPFACLGGRCSW